MEHTSTLIRNALLQPELGLTECSQVAEILTLTKPGFILRAPSRELMLRVRGHFDLVTDGVLVDPRLGTLALFCFLESATNVGDVARRALGDAVYLKHLLIEAVGVGEREEGWTPYLVEVVFVASGATNGTPTTKGEDDQRALGAALRQLVKDSTFPHAVGVSVWRAPHGDPANVRRALPWLLRHTGRWLAASGDPPATNGLPAASAGTSPSEPSNAGRLAAVSLDRFRVAGARNWILASDQNFHLVHGHNGTGKSSLVDAFELALTGEVQAIAQRRGKDGNHQLVITNVDAPRPAATFSFKREGQADQTWSITEMGVAGPLWSGAKHGSFRLHQTFADQLTRSSSAERATHLFDAFFPDQQQGVADLRLAQKDFLDKVASLPPWLLPRLLATPTNPSADQVASDLAWTESEMRPWSEIRALLWLNDAESAALAPLLPASTYDDKEVVSRPIALERLKALHPTLIELLDKSAAFQVLVDEAERFVTAYKDSYLERWSKHDDSDAGEQLNAWLALSALENLLHVHDKLLSVVETAKEGGHELLNEFEQDLRSLASPRSPAERTERLEAIRRAREEAQPALRSTPIDESPTSPASHKPLPPLGEFKLEALDEAAAAGLLGAKFVHCSPPLSHAIREVFERRRDTAAVFEVRSDSALIRVGEKGWTRDLEEGLKAAKQAVAELRRLDLARRSFGTSLPRSAPPPSRKDSEEQMTSWVELLGGLRKAATLAQAKEKTTKDGLTKLLDSDRPLGRALNELLALFTPARWAYEDIVSKVSVEKGVQGFSYQAADGVSSELRLNTAELNTLALALFLLCGWKRDNPLRVLVLDDPLQNMDELTVVTVARGLRRLLALHGSLSPVRWDLMMLLHGEETAERVRREIPSAFYRLSWRSPARSEPTPDEVTAEDTLLKHDLQRLSSVAEAAAPALAPVGMKEGEGHANERS